MMFTVITATCWMARVSLSHRSLNTAGYWAQCGPIYCVIISNNCLKKLGKLKEVFYHLSFFTIQ